MINKPLLGRLTYQDVRKILNITDKQLVEYIRNKRLVPKTTLYSEGPFFDIAEVRKILNEDKGVDLLPQKIAHDLLPPELEEISQENLHSLSLHDIYMRYGFCKNVIERWIRQGKIKAYTEKSGEKTIKIKELEELFRQNMDKEKKEAIETVLARAETIEEKMGLIVHRIKALHTNAMSRVVKELQELKTVGENIELAWFRVEKCHQGCILGEKDLCSHYYAETTDFGISPCIKQVTMKKELMVDLKQKILILDIEVTPIASAYIELISDAVIDYIFGRMLIQEMQGMPSENTESGLSLKKVIATTSSARKNREHIAELLTQFGDYIKQLKPPAPPDKPPVPDIPPIIDVVQKFWKKK